jgi:hypothetical protein
MVPVAPLGLFASYRLRYVAPATSDDAIAAEVGKASVWHTIASAVNELDAEPWATPRAWAEKMDQDAVLAVLRQHGP